MRMTWFVGVAIMTAMLAGSAGAETLKVSNEFLSASYDMASGKLTLRAAGASVPFVKDVALSQAGGKARIIDGGNKIYGQCKTIEITYADGGRDLVLAPAKLPFALLRSTVHNGTKEATITNRVRPAAFTLDLGAPASELKVLGTGGLTTAGNKPGSYMWLAVAEPKSRRGVVAGWITADRGSGAVFAEETGGAVRVTGQIDYGRLKIAPGADETLETLAVGFFDDARLGLEAWADAVARVYDIHLPPILVGYCTWYHAGASDEKGLAEQTAFAAENLKKFGLDFLQIDDGWQEGKSPNGPRKNFTTYQQKGPYPSGMKATADNIRAHGFVPGLWFMPFAGTFGDPWFADKQDIFVKTADGKPYDTSWGGTCIDMTSPAGRKYMQDIVRRVAHDWGYKYFKMDGMWTGTATRQQYVNSGYKDDGIGDAVLHDPNFTNIQAYRGGLSLIRQTAGKDVFILGCCAPQNMRSYGGAFGMVDAMRIGPDNGPDWGGLKTGPTFGTWNYHLNGRIWYNDPDPLYVRASTPVEEARLICSWVTIAGALSVSSDGYAVLSPERLDILKRTMPSHTLRARPVDLFDEPLARIWQVTDTRRTPRLDVVGLYNWNDGDYSFDIPASRLGLAADKTYAAFDFWANVAIPPFKGSLVAKLPKHTCQVLAIREVTDRPAVLSTSRHITQGVVDIVSETWDPAARTLAGTSKVVAGDPYELRVPTTSTAGAWKPVAAEVSEADRAAGVSVSMKAEGDLCRVTINSAASRDVKWKVVFEGPKK